MNPRITLIRAISSEFIRRKLASLILIFSIVLGVLLVASVWLVTRSAWWWLLVAAVVMAIIWSLVILVIIKGITRLLKPSINDAQAASVIDFVDKLERNLENVQTPLIFIEFKILRDLIWPRDDSFIQSAVRDGGTLHKDFVELDNKFKSL